MEAGHQAAAGGQRPQGVDAAGEAQIDVQPGQPAGDVAQARQRQVAREAEEEAPPYPAKPPADSPGDARPVTPPGTPPPSVPPLPTV